MSLSLEQHLKLAEDAGWSVKVTKNGVATLHKDGQVIRAPGSERDIGRWKSFQSELIRAGVPIPTAHTKAKGRRSGAGQAAGAPSASPRPTTRAARVNSDQANARRGSGGR